MEFRTKKVQRSDREPLTTDLGAGVDCTIDPYQKTEWHAKIDLGSPDGISSVLIQGFGDTPEIAIREAIVKGSAYHREALSRIEALYHRIHDPIAAGPGPEIHGRTE